MKICIFSLGCLLSIAWSVVSAQEITPSAMAASEKQDEYLKPKKHDKDDLEEFDLDALIEKYNKYESIMSQLGLAHKGHQSRLGTFLKYVALPAGFASFWLSVYHLIGSENIFDMSDNQARITCCAIGTIVYLMCLYSGDYYQNKQEESEASRAKIVLVKLVKIYEEQRDSFPKELESVAKLLQQHFHQNGEIDLEDGLLTSLVDEIVKEHKVTRDEVRKCIAQVNAEVFE